MMTYFSPIIIPELFLAVTAMLLLVAGVCRQSSDTTTGFIFKLSITVVILTIWLVTQLDSKHELAFHGLFVLDGFAIFTKIVLLIGGLLVLMIAQDYTQGKYHLPFEFPILAMLSLVGMMLMVSANSMLSFYLALELQSLALYVLTAIDRNSDKSSEAGLKYFMLGALASGIILFGTSLLYGFAGTVEFDALTTRYASGDATLPLGVLVGMILIFIGLCFKLSAVPFHMWAPDVYEGAPKPVVAFLAGAPKVAAMALFIRVAMQPFGAVADQWHQIIIFISLASMVVGAFGALRQSNIKRLMAYSSIGHMGYILMGLAAGSQTGIHAMLIYAALYVVMNAGVFACIMVMKRCNEHVEDIHDLAGVAKTHTIYAAILSILMFSMAGIPPLAGFFGKVFVFQAALEAELYLLAIVGVLSSVVGAYYYIRIVKVMYFDTPPQTVQDTIEGEMSSNTRLVMGIAGVANLLFFLYPTPLLEAAKMASESLF